MIHGGCGGSVSMNQILKPFLCRLPIRYGRRLHCSGILSLYVIDVKRNTILMNRHQLTESCLITDAKTPHLRILATSGGVEAQPLLSPLAKIKETRTISLWVLVHCSARKVASRKARALGLSWRRISDYDRGSCMRHNPLSWGGGRRMTAM